MSGATVVDSSLGKVRFLGDGEICHIATGLGRVPPTVCGEPYNCPSASVAEWEGATICADCGRPICPECLQRANL